MNTPDITVSAPMAAPAAAVWDLVCDPTRMGRWSPEAVSQQWLAPATTAAPGARFRGRNRNGIFRWSTVSTVAEFVPGHVLSWDVEYAGMAVSRWSLSVEPGPDDGSSILTQSFWDRRGPVMHVLGIVGRGVRNVAPHNRAGMERTLAAIAGALAAQRV